MIELSELRPRNLITYNYYQPGDRPILQVREIIEKVDADKIFLVNGVTVKPEDCQGILLDQDNLKHFGFRVYDMGDYWQFEMDDIVLVQVKFQILPNVPMEYTLALPKDPKWISFKFIHQLQSFYTDYKNTELRWKY